MALQYVAKTDPAVASAISQELARQRGTIELIASENIASPSVMEAMGSVLTNKYAEGYPGKRYYGGCEKVDLVEDLARDRACELFGAGFANVQPHSGAQRELRRVHLHHRAGRHGARHEPRPGRPPHARLAGQLLGQVLRVPCLRPRPGDRDHRLRRDGAPGEGDSPEAHRGRRERLPAHHRLRAHAPRSPTKWAPTSWWTWRTSPASWPRARIPSPVPYARHHHHDDAQDPARPARRPHPHQRRGALQEDQHRRVPRRPGRPAHARHRRQGRRLRRGAAAVLQGVHRPCGRERPHAGRGHERRRPAPRSPAAPTITCALSTSRRRTSPARTPRSCSRPWASRSTRTPSPTSRAPRSSRAASAWAPPAGTTRGLNAEEFYTVGELHRRRRVRCRRRGEARRHPHEGPDHH